MAWHEVAMAGIDTTMVVSSCSSRRDSLHCTLDGSRQLGLYTVCFNSSRIGVVLDPGASCSVLVTFSIRERGLANLLALQFIGGVSGSRHKVSLLRASESGGICLNVDFVP